MEYSFEQIASLFNCRVDDHNSKVVITNVSTDSRTIFNGEHTLFFALRGVNWNAHNFIDDAISKGVRLIIVDQAVTVPSHVSVLKVENTLDALQAFASFHRSSNNISSIAISGSYGKTIVKEWLFKVLTEDRSVVRSPKSYNSQVGVPLSLFQIESFHEIGIFEAGISKQGEMNQLCNMIQADIGVLTNIGDAHNEGFESKQCKIREKLLLFKNCKKLICNSLDEEVNDLIKLTGVPVFSWGYRSEDNLQILSEKHSSNTSFVFVSYLNKIYEFEIPFVQKALLENVYSVISASLYIGLSISDIKKRVKQLQPISMRLEISKGINNCTVINDFCNSDFFSIKTALEYLNLHHKKKKKVVILSDIIVFDDDSSKIIQLLELLKEKDVTTLIGIGNHFVEAYSECQRYIDDVHCYPNTEAYLKVLNQISFKEATILLKGTHFFHFERLKNKLEEQIHDTVLEVNLNKVRNNLNAFRGRLFPDTKVMAMIKADSYGSGGNEMADYLESLNVDYFGVAYIDEGIRLRKAGIRLPIMVMNINVSIQLETIIENKLEVEIYSINQLLNLVKELKNSSLTQFPIHIKFDTGMNRLGICDDEIPQLIEIIKQHKEALKICSVFSHLACSDQLSKETFTKKQFSCFHTILSECESILQEGTLKHILNTAGIINYPQEQMDMVRMGIGFYGVQEKEHSSFEQALSLTARIAQIKDLKKGDSIGYTGDVILQKDKKLAIVKIGYADGFDRRLGNGIYSMNIGGVKCPTLGQICMDLTYIDVSHIDHVKDGMIVEVIGDGDVEEIASILNTIPYEVISKLSNRIKRNYIIE